MIVQQLILLEKQDLVNLKQRTTLTINVGGADVMVGYAGARKAKRIANGHDHEEEPEESLSNSRALEEHRGIVGSIKKVPCPQCGKKYDPRGLHIHVGAAHRGKRIGGNVGAPGKHARPGPTKKKSKYRGVYLHKQTGKWRAQVHVKGVGHSLGAYHNEVDAARAYDAGALKWVGENAVLNFPKAT